ncbi:MAG: peptidoglycan editing factor PgeF [Alphaproteobacteria bacterium]|nr:MAG: peptidoglycan editing factor PgeF [Alphaproteobacteria bacterium]
MTAPPRPIRSAALGVAHGFFTRQGGVSQGVYAGLNCGPGSGDDPAAVQANRAAVAAAMGLDPGRLVSLSQIHSARVVKLDAPPAVRPEGDAMVTDRAGLGLGVLTADCAPILLADPDAGVIGAAHAGWRGALGGVIEATIAAMRALGARDIRAAVGPCISQRAYEVGPDFLDAFMAEDPGHARFFAGGRGDRLMFDLPGFCLARLRAAGVDAEWTGHCTHGDAERFFSWRRTSQSGGRDYGRLISVIRL